MKSIEIIGTSHIASQSISQISRKILEEKPEIVCVELDRTRLLGLFRPEQKVRLRDLKVGGFGALFMLVGRWLQKKLGAQVGIMPGADMKSAVIAARKTGAKIYLIDIPIQKTLYKLSKEVSAWEKARLIGYILFSPLSRKNRETIEKIDLTKVPAESVIDSLIADMRTKFPQMFKVLLDDRNEFMARQLKKIAKDNPDDKIIAVVGAGHKKGLQNILFRNNNKIAS